MIEAIEIALGSPDFVSSDTHADNNDDTAAEPILPEQSFRRAEPLHSSLPNANSTRLRNPFSGLSRRASAPGVVHVRGRAPGQVPTWAHRNPNSAPRRGSRRLPTISTAGSRLFPSRRTSRISNPVSSPTSTVASTICDQGQDSQRNGTANHPCSNYQTPLNNSASSLHLNPLATDIITAEVRVAPSGSKTSKSKSTESPEISNPCGCCVQM
mmetsp:Transcript_4234/g.5503  ORF Transcript_4234/g.5503 Transcript_4234/m.5503 type:complete len:212 (-) Transcript_4234:642-1277(-)